eukprot:4404454-Pyramimonas_sp.AAC.1
MPRKIDRVSVCVLSPARGLLTSEGNHFGVCASNFCALAGLRGCLRGYGGNPNLRHDCEHSDTDALTTRVRKLALVYALSGGNLNNHDNQSYLR